jgi:hypothetical protein
MAAASRIEIHEQNKEFIKLLGARFVGHLGLRHREYQL